LARAVNKRTALIVAGVVALIYFLTHKTAAASQSQTASNGPAIVPSGDPSVIDSFDAGGGDFGGAGATGSF